MTDAADPHPHPQPVDGSVVRDEVEIVGGPMDGVTVRLSAPVPAGAVAVALEQHGVSTHYRLVWEPGRIVGHYLPHGEQPPG